MGSDPEPLNMDMHHTDERVTRLRALYEESEAARRLFDHLSARTKNSVSTSVDRLDAKVNGVPRAKIEELLRTFEEIGLGKFVLGRVRNKVNTKTRFDWAVSLISVGQVAAGQSDYIVSWSPIELEEDEEYVHEVPAKAAGQTQTKRHVFPLRADFDITIELPADLNPHEAARLGKFVQSLPYGR